MSKSVKNEKKSSPPAYDEDTEEDTYVPPFRQQRLYHESHPIASLSIHRSKDFNSGLYSLTTVKVLKIAESDCISRI
jgi:hypothetical protein